MNTRIAYKITNRWHRGMSQAYTVGQCMKAEKKLAKRYRAGVKRARKNNTLIRVTLKDI